jgi:hypothetical protein
MLSDRKKGRSPTVRINVGMNNLMQRLILQPEQVYGWTMYPGYGDIPYRSPIFVVAIRPLGHRQLELEFINILYAAGVQRMTKQLRTMRRAETFIVAEELGPSADRVVIVERLTRDWVRHSTPQCIPSLETLFDDSGAPRAAEFCRLASRT